MPGRDEVEQLRAELDGITTHLHDIERLVTETNGNVLRLKAEIGPGLPDPAERGDRPTLRDRMHKMEDNDRTMLVLAEGLTGQLEETAKVVADLKNERDKLAIEREAFQRRWSTRKTRLVTAAVAIGIFTSTLGLMFAALKFFGFGD